MARGIRSYGSTNKSNQSLLVNLVTLVEVNGTPCSTFEARIEEV